MVLGILTLAQCQWSRVLMVGHVGTALKSMVVGFAVVVASLTMLLYSATDMFLVSTGLG